MVAALDDAVAMITGALEKKGVLDNTIVVFHSDNGGSVAHKFATGDGDVTRSAASNGPSRDGKGSVYEGGVRVPALMRWTKGLEGGTMGGLMHVTDMYPTLLKLAGGNIEQRRPLDGVDQWPAIKDNKASARKDILLAAEDFRAAIRVGDWKLVLYSTLPQRTELYDVPHDQGEEDNAAERNPELVKEMTVKLNEYLWEMSPSKYVEELLRARKGDMPMVWGANPPRLGAGSQTDNRKDPSLTVERADQQKKE
jgi:arylsulfatase A-like enzyme